MKKVLPILAPLFLFITVGFYNYIFGPYVTTIAYVQTVPAESLAIGHDRSPHVGDTVTVIGRVTAPPRVNPSGGDIRRLLRGTTSFQAYIQDTSNGVWGGMVVRQADSVSNTNFDLLDSGMKVRVTGIVQEYPDIISSGMTQIKLDTLQTVTVLPTVKKRPVAIPLSVSVFDSLGNVKFRTGEQYEGMYVKLSNVTVGPQSASGQRHIRSLLDASGNHVYLRDFSNFFSIAPSPSWGWTAWTPPSVGATIDSIRGVIINGAYADANAGLYPYVIVPIYPNDYYPGNAPPFISTVTRNPGVPKPADSVQVSATVVDTMDNPLSVVSVHLIYRINRSSYTLKQMSNVGSIYYAKLPPAPLGSLVEYFIRAQDNMGGVRLNPSDTSRSTYFYYTRLSDTMTIKDIQYTPNNGGYSGYNGYDVTTTGIVTLDTADIPAFTFISPYGSGTQTSPRRVIIQDPGIAGGWSGIWINGSATDPLQKGQLVRVHGTVDEVNSITKITVATPGDITIISSNNQIPAYTLITPGDVANAKVKGDTTAEKWESVLVRFDNQVVLTCINAEGSTNGCTTILPLPDTTFRRNYGEILGVYAGQNVQARIELQDGHHSFRNGWDPAQANWYNPSLPGNLLYQADGINGLQGVMYFSFSHYKLVPTKNGDFGSVIGIKIPVEYPSVFWLKQNYPNPFNPVTNIVYNLPSASEVSIRVYNVLGQQVKTLVSGIQNSGRYTIQFDGSNLASGLYFYILEGTSLETGKQFNDVKKMVLVK